VLSARSTSSTRSATQAAASISNGESAVSESLPSLTRVRAANSIFNAASAALRLEPMLVTLRV